MVEGARLESVYRGNSIEGSNPSVSAQNLVYIDFHNDAQQIVKQILQFYSLFWTEIMI